MTCTKLSITVSSVIAAMTLVGCSGNMKTAGTETTTDNLYKKTVLAKDYKRPVKRSSQKTTSIQVANETSRVNASKQKQPQKRVASKKSKTPYREDSWQQIYRGFKIPNYNRQPRVQQSISKLSRHPKHLTRMSVRANPYLPYIVNAVKQQGMPSEIALLPFVESSFRPNAYSSANAAGLWQFIPETGKRYGLKQTHSFDGRYDPFLSTNAALGYLKKLNRQFNGDWLLSLAAYNCGENRVQREINKNKAAGRPTDFWHLDLPKETQQYVPRLLAYKEIYRQPARYSINLPERNPRSEPIRTKVGKSIDLRQIAIHAGLPSNTLTRINRAYKTGISTPELQKGEVNFPRPHANRLLRIINDIPELSEEVVQQTNRKARRKATIMALRKKATKARRTKKARIAKVTRSAKRKAKLRKKTVAARTPRVEIVTHRVRRGDTLAHIAKRYGVSIHRIMRMNKMRSTTVQTGKRLKVAIKTTSRRRG